MATGGGEIGKGGAFIPAIHLGQVPQMVEDIEYMIDYNETEDMEFLKLAKSKFPDGSIGSSFREPVSTKSICIL